MQKAAAAAIAVASTACSAAGGGARWEGTVTDSAGIEIVRNTNVGTWRPEDRWTLTETLRIGTAEGDPDYQFGSIPSVAGLAIASDGRIVAADLQARHLKVFAPDGRYQRTVGGPGAGPGEFGIQGLQVVIAPGDTLVVSDLGNQRVSLFLLDGTFVRSFPQSYQDGFAFRWDAAEDGRLVTQLRRVAFPGSTAPPDTMDVIAERSLDGALGATLLRVPSGKTFSFTGGAPEWHLFVPEPLWALWGDRVLYAVSDAYRISVFAPGGSLERVIEKPFTLEPVTEVDRQVMLQGFEKILKDQGLPPQMVPQFLQRVHFAENYPAFGQGGMAKGPDGSIMVQLVRTVSQMSPEEREGLDLQSGGSGSPDWDVFDRDGRYLGVITMPPRFQPVEFLGDRIYGIQQDDLDVQYIVVLGVVKGPAA
jgi:hypothetical protein